MFSFGGNDFYYGKDVQKLDRKDIPKKDIVMNDLAEGSEKDLRT